MSGLDALAALGLASNIMQVISFAHETVSLCRAVYAGRTPDAHLKEAAASLATVAAEVYRDSSDMSRQTPTDRRLAELADRCTTASRALAEEIHFLTSEHAKGSLAKTLLIAQKRKWRQDRLARLERQLDTSQSALQTQLLGRICKQSDVIELQDRQSFEKLGETVQVFISQYGASNKQLSDLIKSETRLAKDHTTSEMTRAELAVKQAVNIAEVSLSNRVSTEIQRGTSLVLRDTREAKTQAIEDNKRERFLQSLKFPAMNERRNHIEGHHPRTFKWIFETASPSSSEVERDTDEMFDTLDIRWDNFKEWLMSSSSLYWISGKPGSGKSTLIKYIISSPHTKAALSAWKQDTEIVSHFFWKPGSTMQNSRKGLLCSLLYQILSSSVSVLNAMLASFPGLSSKDSETDWSVDELHSIFLKVLAAHPSPFAIFIDGLDENCDKDGLDPLFKIINELMETPGVKVCVASRPELRIMWRLNMPQQLKLQELTRDDMRTYVHAQLPSQSISFKTRHLLIRKAEGVFLWLSIAVRQVLRGLENGDDEYEIEARVNNLPSELSDLYNDMWGRLEEDDQVYRQHAAQLLRLSLLFQNKRLQSDGTVFNFMVATHQEAQEAFLEQRAAMDEMKVQELCETTRKRIETRCASLLVIHKGDSMEPWLREADGHTYHAALPYLESTVAFIHRTAVDFLTDTEEGRLILAHDQSVPDQLLFNIMKARLATAKILPKSDGPIMRILEEMPPLDSNPLEVKTVLQTWWKWWDRCLFLRSPKPPPKFIRPHFLALISHRPGLYAFILYSIRQSPNPSALATEILQDISYRNLETNSMVKSLLSMGAAPNSKGVTHRFSFRSSVPETVSCASPFGLFLIENIRGHGLASTLDTLLAFLGSDAQLDEHIPLFITITLEFRNLPKDNAIYVFDVNLAFLVELICQRYNDSEAHGEEEGQDTRLLEHIRAIADRKMAGAKPGAQVAYMFRYQDKRIYQPSDTLSRTMVAQATPWLPTGLYDKESHRKLSSVLEELTKKIPPELYYEDDDAISTICEGLRERSCGYYTLNEDLSIREL